MTFAFVFVHWKDKKKGHEIVETDRIQKFSIRNYFHADKTTRASIPYSLFLPNGGRVTCQVLEVADSAVEIEAITASKRYHVPKLNSSALNYGKAEDSDDGSSTSSIEEQRKKKILKRHQQLSATDAEGAIVSKYQKLNNFYGDNSDSDGSVDLLKTRGTKESRQVIVAAHVNKYLDDSESDTVAKPLMSSTFDKENTPPMKTLKRQKSQGATGDCYKVSKNDSSVTAIDEKKEEVSRKKIQDLERKLVDAETDVQIWKDKYYNLLKSDAYPLTEKTGKMIISVLQESVTTKNYAKPLKKGHSSAESIKENSETINVEGNFLESQTNDITASENGTKKLSCPEKSNSSNAEHDELVDDLLLRNFKNTGECAKAITKSLWTTEELKERTVKETGHTNKKQLTPKKVEQATSIFSKWLKRRGYMKDARALELKSLKAHMGRVIDNINRQDKKIKNAGAKNTPVTKKTSASNNSGDNEQGGVRLKD